jgi:hypothetical protein
MRYGVNGSIISGLHHSNDNPIECEKKKGAKKAIVKKPGALMWVMNLLLPFSSLTMPFLHNPTTIQPFNGVTAVDRHTQINQTQYSSDDKVNT